MTIYSTNNLVTAVKKEPAAPTFLGRRYFPTTSRDIFKGPKVAIERTDEGNLAAPFVVPYSGSTLMEREAYTGELIEPAFINPSRDMTIDTLRKKGIGETEFDEVAPEEREQRYLADDLVWLEKSVTRRIEWMRGQILTKGYVDCKLYKASGDASPVRFKFYEGGSFGNVCTFSAKWSEGGDKYAQISSMVNDIPGQYGNIDLLVGKNLVADLVEDDKILKMLHVANANFGQLNPQMNLEEGVGFFGALNFGGKTCNVFSYTECAEVDGEQVHYIDPDAIVALPAAGFGATKYAAITQMEQEDREFHTRSGEMVPRYVADVNGNSRKLEMASAPLPCPYALDSWRVMFPNK